MDTWTRAERHEEILQARVSEYLYEVCRHILTHTQWCTTILNGCVLHSVGSVGIVYDLTVSQSSRLVSDVSLYVVSSLTGQMLGIYCKLSGGFSVKS